MARFCEFCGTQIADNMKCTCPGALENEQKVSEKPTETISVVNTDAIKKTYGDVKGTIFNLLKDPESAAAKADGLNSSTIGALLGLQVISALLFICLLSIRAGINISGSSLGYTFLIMVVEIGLMFISLLLLLRFFKSQKLIMQVLSSMSIASLPWSAVILAMAVIGLVLGTSQLFSIISICLIVFAVVSSICILVAALRDEGISNLANLLSVSVAYAVHFALLMWVIYMMAGDVLSSVMWGLF